jgi:hypothetical protein
MLNEYVLKYYGNDIHIMTNDKDKFINQMKNYQQIDKGINHLNGSDDTIVQILFVNNSKKEAFKNIILENIEKDNDIYFGVYFLETKDYTIFITNKQLEEHLSDFAIIAGKGSATVLEFFASLLAPKLKDIVCIDVPEYKKHEERLQQVTPLHSQDEDVIKFYSLLMDNLMLNVIKDAHAKNYHMAYELYLYEKVRQSLKNEVTLELNTDVKVSNIKLNKKSKKL